MSHNEKLASFLEQLKSKSEQATHSKDWERVFQDLKTFPAPIKFDHSTQYSIIIVMAIMAGIQGLLMMNGFSWGPFSRDFSWDHIAFGVLACGAVGAMVSMASNASQISTISDMIFDKDVFWDNQLQEISTAGKYEDYNRNFYDFGRGDQTRVIRRVIAGRFEGAEHSFDYELYKFSYIVVTYRTVKVGKSTTVQRVETTYYRYGLVCDFPYLKSNLLIGEDLRGSLKYSWETSSSDFNGRFSVSTDSEAEAAKFLSPSTVLAFCDGLNLSSMNFEFMNQRLCISFGDDDLYSLERKFGIEQPDLFEKEIKENLVLPKLKELEKLIYKLMINSDSNFK